MESYASLMHESLLGNCMQNSGIYNWICSYIKCTFFGFFAVASILPFNCTHIIKSSRIVATSCLLSFLSRSLKGSVLLHLGPKPESVPWIVHWVALTVETVAQLQAFGMSFALKFLNLQNNWKAVMVAESSGRLVYQAPKETSCASIACLCVSLQQYSHSLLCHREFRSKRLAK